MTGADSLMWNCTSTAPNWGMTRMKVKELIELLQEDTNPEDKVLFDVKRVESCQDFGRLNDVYWDGELILELH